MDTLRAAGDWWMPEMADHKVPGVLKYDFSDAGRLTLIGGLRRPEHLAEPEPMPDGATRITVSQDLIEAAGNYGRLHGECEGKAYTLDGCFQLSSRGKMFGPTNEEVIYVNHVYQGVWFSADDEAAGDTLDFAVDGLSEWVAKSGMVLTVDHSPAEGEPWAELQATPLPDRKAALPGGGEATLSQRLSYSFGNPASISESFGLRFRYPNTVAVEDLVDAASDIQDLVSIATDRSAQFGPVAVSRPDTVDHPGGGSFIVWSAWTALRKASDKPLRASDLFFSLDDLGGMDGVAEWMKVAEKYRTALGRIMATKYAERMYVSDRFLNRVVALEGFDRIDTGKSTGRAFAASIRRCIDLAGPQFLTLVNDPDKWATELKHHRNELAHHYGRRMRQAAEESLYIGNGAFWLFVFCLLREASVADAVFDKITAHQELQFLARKNRTMFS